MLKNLAKFVLEPIRKDGKLSVDAALTKGRVASREIDGKIVRWLVTNRNDEIQSKQIEQGFYELPELRRLKSVLGVRKRVVDIGANIGNHSVFFSMFMGTKDLVCIEPYGKARKHLLVNLSLNCVEADNIRVLSCAIGPKRATAKLVLPTEYNIGLTRVESDVEGDVVVLPGDEIVGDSGVDLIKIDVEGMELGVLDGLIGVLEYRRPAVYVEVSTATQCEVRALMGRIGYRLVDESSAYSNQINMTYLSG